MGKVINILLFLTLILSQINCQQKQFNEDEANKVIERMENSKFGKTLLDTIQLQLNAGNPVDDLIKLLRDMEQQLQQEQREDDDFIFSLQDQCDEEIQRLNDQIQQAHDRITELTQELSIKVPRRDQSIETRDQKLGLVDLYTQRISELDASKELKDQEWDQIQQEHDSAQYAIEQAKSIITKNLKSKGAVSSFAQIQPVFVQVSNHIRSNLKQVKYTKKSWTSIFNLLADVTLSQDVQADQSAVEKVIQLCQDIISKISESRELERNAYKHWNTEYQNTKNGIQERIDDENSQIAELNQTIDVLTRRINMAQDEKKDQQTRIEEKTLQLNDKTQWCDDENNNYSKRRQARGDDIEVISDAIALFNSQIKLFKKYVGDRINKK